MDDDAFADLLRSQSSNNNALPSFYSTPANQPTSDDPFANPFADDINHNPFSSGPSSSAAAALPSTGFGGSTSGGFGADEDTPAFPSASAVPQMPTLSERQDAAEVNGMMEDVEVDQKAGGGIVEVSPYVQRLAEPGVYGTASEADTGGFDGLDGIRSTTLDAGGFGTTDLNGGGFQTEPPAFQQPYTSQPSTGFSTNPYDQPFSSPYDQQPTYSSPPLPPPPISPPQSQLAFTSPTKPLRSALPASLLGPPSDMLGTTPEESLKAAFVKKTQTTPSRPGSAPPLDDPAAPATPSASSLPPSETSSPVPAEKKPYVFKPGGGSVKRRKGEGLRQGDREQKKTLSALASQTVVATGPPPPVPEKDAPVATPVAEVPKEEVAKEEVVAGPEAATEGEPDQAVEEKGVPPQVAEKIMTAEDPQEASKEVAEEAVAKSDGDAVEEKQVASKAEEAAGGLEKLSIAPQSIPLPDSEAPTPRATTPAPPTAEAEEPATPAPEKSEPPPSIFREQQTDTPITASTPGGQSAQFDRVMVSPLEPETAKVGGAQPFHALSVGGSSPAISYPEASSTAATEGASSKDASSSVQSKQMSWGRAYDEPDSPPPPQQQQQQAVSSPSPAMQGWTTDVPAADLGSQSALAEPLASSGTGGGGWGSPGYSTQPLGGGGGETGDASMAWGGGGYQSPLKANDEPEDEETSSRLPRSPSATSARTRMLGPMFTITLSDPTKVGDPIRGYVVYTVTTRTTSPHYRRAEFSVLRRFSDFLWLFEAVSANNPGVIVPPVPDKHPFGRFEEQFVETRRAALERCVKKMANHPVLALDQDLRLFLESDSFSLEIKHRRQEMTQEKQGLLAGLTGPKFIETDEWFDNRKSFLDALESQLKALTKSIEGSSRQRLELAVLVDHLADSVGQLAESDLAVDLTAALQRLSGLGKKEKEMLETQAKMDIVHLMNSAEEYIRLIGSVRLAFASRIKSYLTWQNVEAETRRLRQQHDKLRKTGKIAQDRIQPALAEIADADRRAVDAHSDFDAVTRLVKIEFGRFEQERIQDFKAMLEAYLDGMIERQRELIQAWENYHAILARMVSANQGKPINGSQ